MELKEKEAIRQEDVETPVEEVVPVGGVSRRNFLKYASLGVAGGAVALTLPKVAAARDPKVKDPVPDWLKRPHVINEKFWKKVQKEFTLNPDQVYMNIGTTGSMPRRVLDNFNAHNRIVAKYPWTRRIPGTESWSSTTAMRNDMAAGFGCNPNEIWISENTTNGLAQILMGLNWCAWQAEFGTPVILTSIHEHGAGRTPMGKIAARYNAHIQYTDHPRVPKDPAEYIAEYEQSFQDVYDEFGYYPQVMMITHTPYVTGATLPIKQLSQLAHSKGTVVVYDGAHNTGMFDGFFDDCECDFYSGSGHKWQCGPGRTGIGFVRNQLDTTSFPLPEIMIPEGSSRGPREIGDNYAGGFQSHGNPNYPAYRAQYESCMLWDAIGRDNIHQYILDLSAYTKQRILDTFPMDGDDIFHCPWDCLPEMTSGLTTMNPFADITDGGKAFEYRERLREEYDYIIRYTTRYVTLEDQLAGGPRGYAMRISTHLFHNFDQIDGLVAAMYDLWGKMGMGASHRTIPKGDIDNTDYC